MQVDKYQEQSHLLDQHLEAAINPVMKRVRTTLRTWHAAREARAASAENLAFADQVYTAHELHALFQFVYHLCKTRGYKHIIRLFPHEVADLEPAVQALVCQDSADHGTWETRYVILLWLSILVLIPFDLRTVDSSIGTRHYAAGSSLIDSIVSVCQSFLCEPGAVRDASAVCLSRLLTRPDMDTNRLRGFTHWAAERLAQCAGASAPDEAHAVSEAVQGEGAPSSIPVEEDVTAQVRPAVAVASRVFLATGILQALVECAKHGHRDTLKDVLSDVFSRVMAILGPTSTTSSGPTAGRATGLRASPLLRKLTCKLAARTGLTYLPPRVVQWRYSRGSRSLLDNLSSAGVAAAKAKKQQNATGQNTDTAAPSPSKPAAPSADLLRTGNEALVDTLRTDDGPAGEAVDDAHVDVPAETEDIIDLLLQGLRDTDTVVRWSSAKGIGRVTGRLPLEFADDVVAAVLQLLVPRESDAAWHGACLALAELARRGLLLPTRLDAVVPLVLQALSYDVRRGSHSVGAHVRDAACYVCWAFARAYAPGVMRPHVLNLARGMLVTALFDREVNCRRAAGAAFQENVGRQGHENFPNGIAILTAADYFTLGNRANAYLGVAPYVATFDAYKEALHEHVLHVKLRHWDRDVRELSAKAAAALAEQDAAWGINVALPFLLPLVTNADIFIRHGAILGIAEIALAVSRTVDPVTHAVTALPAATQDEVRNVVVMAEKARAYTGRGGEMVRVAMCRLIEAQCLAGHAISRKAALRLLQTLDDCLKHPNDSIQASAVAALKALTAHALSEPEPAVLDRLTKTYITKLSDENPAVRRGSALALGALPRSLLVGGADGSTLDAVLKALLKAVQPERQAYKRDAETRRNACMAIGDVSVTVGIGSRRSLHVSDLTVTEAQRNASSTTVAGSASLPGLDSTQLCAVVDGLVLATKDYAVDNRGDVGSWVRKAALESMERILASLAAVRAVSQRVQSAVGALSSAGASEDSRSSSLLSLLPCTALDPLTLCGGLAVQLDTMQCTSGYGNISGYGAGMRLLTATALAASGSVAVQKALRLPPPANTATNGVQLYQLVRSHGSQGLYLVTAILSAGAVAGVTSITDGTSHCVPVAQLTGVSSDPCATVASVLATLTGKAAAVDRVLPLPAVPEELGESILPHDKLTLAVGTFLRLGAEKLDLLRAVAGDALCRMLHAPPSLPPFSTLPHLPELQAAFPQAQAWVQAGQADVCRSGDDELGEEDAEASGDVAAVSGEEGQAAQAEAQQQQAHGASSTSVQWSIPHQCFPRLSPLLACATFTPYLVEGMITSVGGLSESVVKHSSAALQSWALESKRAGKAQALQGVADALTALLQPRPRLPWETVGADDGDVGGPGGAGISGTIASQGFDPSLARWFKEILGTDAGTGHSKKGGVKSSDGSPDINSTHKVDVRVVVPTLRTLDLLLSCGSLDILRPPHGAWGSAIVALVRRRVMASKEDVPRVLAASSVFLGLLSFRSDEPMAATGSQGPKGPVVPAALVCLLDLLGHPFPRVRKSVAEQMYVRLLTLDDRELAATEGWSCSQLDECRVVLLLTSSLDIHTRSHPTVQLV